MKIKEATLVREVGMQCYPFSHLTHPSSGEQALLKARRKGNLLILCPGDTPTHRYSHQGYFSFSLMTNWVSAPSQQLANIMPYKHKIGHRKSHVRIKPIAHSSSHLNRGRKWGIRPSGVYFFFSSSALLKPQMALLVPQDWQSKLFPLLICNHLQLSSLT